MATALTWLGHASFRLDSPGGKRIYVDPFLSGNPRTPESEQTPERCDLIVVTHGHGDHVGDTIAIHNELGCPVVAQVELRGWLTRNGVADDGQAHSPNKGGTVAVEGVKVTLTTCGVGDGRKRRPLPSPMPAAARTESTASAAATRQLTRPSLRAA